MGDIEKLAVWGNHSPTMYADYRFATVGGKSVKDMINDQAWNANTFLPTVGKRGAAIIEARGLSSAASAANAAIDHMRDWALGTNGKWVTMGIPSNGEYGIPKEVMFGYPVTCEGGEYKIVEGLRSTHSAKNASTRPWPSSRARRTASSTCDAGRADRRVWRLRGGCDAGLKTAPGGARGGARPPGGFAGIGCLGHARVAARHATDHPALQAISTSLPARPVNACATSWCPRWKRWTTWLLPNKFCCVQAPPFAFACAD